MTTSNGKDVLKKYTVENFSDQAFSDYTIQNHVGKPLAAIFEAAHPEQYGSPTQAFNRESLSSRIAVLRKLGMDSTLSERAFDDLQRLAPARAAIT